MSADGWDDGSSWRIVESTRMLDRRVNYSLKSDSPCGIGVVGSCDVGWWGRSIESCQCCCDWEIRGGRPIEREKREREREWVRGRKEEEGRQIQTRQEVLSVYMYSPSTVQVVCACVCVGVLSRESGLGTQLNSIRPKLNPNTKQAKEGVKSTCYTDDNVPL